MKKEQLYQKAGRYDGNGVHKQYNPAYTVLLKQLPKVSTPLHHLLKNQKSCEQAPETDLTEGYQL